MIRRTLPSDPLNLLREAPDVDPPEGAAARVAAKLAVLATAAVGAAGALAAETPGSGAWQALGERFVRWSLGPLGVGILLGAGGQALLTSQRQAAPPLPALSASPLATTPPPVELAALPVPSLSSSPKPTAPTSNVSTVVEERNLLDKARRQLASDEPARALTFLEEHAQRFTRGALVEEREAMWINVLARLGRSEEAKARGEQFQARFPKSLMGASVRAALSAADAPK